MNKFNEIKFKIVSCAYAGESIELVDDGFSMPGKLKSAFKAKIANTGEDVLISSYSKQVGGGHGEGYWDINVYQVVNLETMEPVDKKNTVFVFGGAEIQQPNVFKKNLAVATDSYKISHPNQFPAGTEYTSYYVEARTDNEDIIAAGMNFIGRVLEQGITVEDVERANRLYKAHFGFDIFHYEGWMRIATEFKGKLPLNFLAVPEGTVMKSKNVIAVLENTHPDFFWLPGHMETFILRAIWYPTSVATKSFKCKKVLNRFMEMTSGLTGDAFNFVLNTRLHDFGARGATAGESAAIGGLAHLYNFIGTDTVEAMILAQDLFNFEGAAGNSIPAREHSTTISWENEDDAFLNSVEHFGGGVYACVMDSYDFNEAVLRVCTEMKDQIIESGGTFVIRPDSGDMILNIMYALETAGKHFGYEYNSKGYKVLNKHVRIIQGDDINSADDIMRVLSWMEGKRWSAENIAFGMGGGLLQKVNRDTHKFAMKLSAIRVNGVWREVFKCPKGAEWKKSKAGQLRYGELNGAIGTYNMLTMSSDEYAAFNTHMVIYHIDGKGIVKDTLPEIRERINNAL